MVRGACSCWPACCTPRCVGPLVSLLYVRTASVAYLNLSNHLLEHQQYYFSSSATAFGQLSLFLGAAGIDVRKASALEDKLHPDGLKGGNQTPGGLAVIFGEEGSAVRDKWEKHKQRLSKYVANQLDNCTKGGRGLFFFTPLFLLVLGKWSPDEKWAQGKKWLNQLKAYDEKPAAMNEAIATIFSQPFFEVLDEDGWCVCSCVLCSYYLWRRTNSDIYSHFFTTPIYTLGNTTTTRTRPASWSASTAP